MMLTMYNLRSAHDLVTLNSQTRHSGVETTSTQGASLNELDNIDIFDFFNLPVTSESSNGTSSSGQTSSCLSHMGGSLPDPESDWLAYQTPYT